MNGFISYSDQLNALLTTIISSECLHAKWLNTLSFLENCGARKIAACEHPTLVKEEMLKHASEEFRHAHYLKKQLVRVTPTTMPDYSTSTMLGGASSLQYLNALDLYTCRYLKTAGFSSPFIKEAAYLLVTYAIELRAAEMYPIYEILLRKTGSRVTVKSILLEEKEHLNEMKAGLQELTQGFMHAERVCGFESHLCKNWIQSMNTNISL